MAKKKLDIIPYNPKLVERARYLRKHGTLAEKLLWKYLRGKHMLGYDFDRQKPMDNYIVDFYCAELKLAIEIDGQSHDGKYTYDHDRQEKLESFGIEFLRFSEQEVRKDMDNVLRVIEQWVMQHSVQNPPPAPPGEGRKPT